MHFSRRYLLTARPTVSPELMIVILRQSPEYHCLYKTLVETVSPSFDPQRNAWSIASANPNLRVVGNFAGPLPAVNAPPGAFSLGFFVSRLPSFMQVARFQGRYFLRDGYHRALGFLLSGINQVPAFVTDISAIELWCHPGCCRKEPTSGFTHQPSRITLTKRSRQRCRLPQPKSSFWCRRWNSTCSYRSLLERPARRPKNTPSPLLNPQFAASNDCFASSGLGGFGMNGSTWVTTKQTIVMPATNHATALKDISPDYSRIPRGGSGA